LKTKFKAITIARYNLRILWVLAIIGMHKEYVLVTDQKVKEITSWYFLCFRLQRIQWFKKEDS